MIQIRDFKYRDELHHFDGYFIDLDNQRVWSEKVQRWLKIHKNRDDYVLVCLTDTNGKQMTGIKLSRLVWTVYYGKQIPDGMEVNHIDEDKENNHPSNLNLMTRKQNINWGTRNTRVSAANTNGKMSKAVAQLTLDGQLVAKWPSTNEAGRNGLNQGNVAACCRGERKTHGGYRWMWLDEYEKQQTPTTTDGQLEFAFEY